MNEDPEQTSPPQLRQRGTGRERSIVRREVATAAAKALIGAVPYVGTALNEALFETRSRIKQERLHRFFALLREYFLEHGISDAYLERCGTEQFGDLLESVLLQVQRTRSRKKVIWFRNLLVNQISPGHAVDHGDPELLSSILATLSDTEVVILDRMRLTSENGSWEANARQLRSKARLRRLLMDVDMYRNTGRAVDELVQAEMRYHEALSTETTGTTPSIALKECAPLFTCEYYGISEEEFRYCLQHLVSSALLADRSHEYDAAALSITTIAGLGKQLLESILLPDGKEKGAP